MFKKPIKIKSNTQIKGSDRKSFKENILKSFPNLTEADVENLLPKKETVNCIKLTTAADETVHVYAIQKRPVVFAIRGTLHPTIYLLWKYPHIAPAFTTHPQVLSFLTSGADLMLPGVVTPPNQSGASKYGGLSENALAYVNLSSNKAAVAVGITAQSSLDMYKSGGRGKCLTILHVYGDKLCTLEGIPNIPVLDLGPPEWLQFNNYDEDFPELGASQNSTEINHEDVIEDNPVVIENIDENPTQEINPLSGTPEEMDDLLNYCFFVAIKYSKTLTLPILTSNFYKLQMIPACPDGKSMDLKKSSFKKLKPFLESMCKDGLITVSEVKKGVESITSVNKDHPKFAEFYIEPSIRPKRENDEVSNASSTSITESFIITPKVLPIFQGFQRGDTIQKSEIRQHVIDYVKKNNLQDEENKRLVKPTELLLNICKTEHCITWEELMEKVCESMKSCYKVSSGNEVTVNKGKVSPITLTVSQRSGNKKVTLVDNLELFGIHIPEFAKECQHGVAASTSISKPPGAKCDQLLVQGNQVLFVYNLLTEKYKVPQRYIKGLENAPKKKKQ